MRKIVLLLCFTCIVGLGAKTVPTKPNFDASLISFRQTLAEMVEADTTNPPGNESRIVHLVAQRLKEAGIPFEITTFAADRQNITARLKGNGPEKPVMLIAHLDVVGTEGQPWSTPPHKLVEKDGYLQGRGVLDMLGTAAMDLEVFLLLKKSQAPLRRDVILAFTGDEESSGMGVRYLLRNFPESINAGLALNEGGGIILDDNGNPQYINLQVTEKGYVDIILTTKGPTGHSSVPLADNAINRLAKALYRLSTYQFPIRLLPVTRVYLEGLLRREPPQVASIIQALLRSENKVSKKTRAGLENNPNLSAIVRTTCVVTTIAGGMKANALPPEATANINCRLLPDDSAGKVMAQLASIVQDPLVEMKVKEDFGPPLTVPFSGELPKSLAVVASRYFPAVPIIPFMSQGASDSRFLRSKGIEAYGLSPIAYTESDGRRAHGADERISISVLRPAIEFYYDLVTTLAQTEVH